jgi:hypothetical protein
MVIGEKALNALAKDEFVMECKEISFIPVSPYADPIIHTGPGSIMQQKDGTFLIKIYCKKAIDPKNVLGQFFERIPGRLIKDDEYYKTEIKDFTGNTWKTDPVLLQFIAGHDFNSYIVEAHCRKLSTQVTAPMTPKADSISIFYRGNITIPSNTATKTETKIGERFAKKESNLNVAVFDAAEMEFEVVSESDGLYLDAISKGLDPTFSTALRISEALQFVLARKLNWSCIKIWQKNTQTTFVSAAQINQKKTRILPPLAFSKLDKGGSVWALFDKYLIHTLKHTEKTWHPIFRRIQAVIASGEASIEAEGLTLSVAIEGLLNDSFRQVGIPDYEFKEKVHDAYGIICRSDIDERIKRRMTGFVNNMVYARGKDRLNALQNDGLIEKKLIENWESLRNPSTHGDAPDLRELQEYIDKCDSTLVLFYQLIFLVIGYIGYYTNYTREGYPIDIFNKKLL